LKAWITKYALTKGIIEIEGRISDNFPSMFCFKRGVGYYEETAHGEGKDWHRTKESALARAEEMRIAKLKSLDKQMKKIAALKFE